MKINNLGKIIFIALFAAVFFIACENEKASVNNNYAINSLFACGLTGSPSDIPTIKIIITVNDDKLVLTADDIKINASFSMIKGELIKKDTTTYELFIIFGNSGTIRVGLDPYQGFTGWDAKTVYVYAKWYFSGTSNLTITGYNSSVVDPSEIPEDIAGKPVTAIGANVFYDKGLISVTIPESVTSIGNYAFANNKLTKIEIPNIVTSIGNYAFGYNKLTEIKIPESVISLSGFNDNELTKVEFLGAKVTSIGSNAFANNMLSSINIPTGVTSIGSSAFTNNILSSINIPAGVISIGSYAFFDNILSSINIPGSVTSIGSYAFSNNPLTSITIGENVTLGTSAFGNGFEDVYNNTYKKAAGRYTRLNTNSKAWTKN
jgi:hypothetical protein